MKITLTTIVLLVLMIACKPTSDPLNHWESAKKFRDEQKITECITELKLIIDNYPEHPKAPESQFMIGDIYLNDVKDYEISIEEFQLVLNNFEESTLSAKAMFMIGYVYANNLHAYSDAEEYYNNFLKNYPEHELVLSVEYELESLKEALAEIKRLNS
ncbi:MAG: tetratricopeptide repeat protein [Candidatus Marinimicrobia bacterium]|nr:tetratricopeptide repeat protein [Candidatus Neomarinimicrobiota bacterium]MBL7023001.1 tetratricopeptide repeat protein [Candidatus Neomarinimicrobiota bacterium]MBL7110052.1 tetratricopeptide repeat protein [Candidatus Neomarinimicrobiota bacterium]